MTLVDLYAAVLEKLGVTAAGESAAAEDTQFIASKYVSAWNLMKIMGIVSWAVVEDVPDEAAQPVIDILAFLSAEEFGDEPARYATGALGTVPPQLAERQLRLLHSRRYVPSTQRTVYF